MEPKRIILEPSGHLKFTSLGFGLAWDPTPSSLFLPFGMGMFILYLSHYCILEKYNSLVSQIPSWKGILSQDELSLESYPLLI